MVHVLGWSWTGTAFVSVLALAQGWPVLPAFILGAMHGRRVVRARVPWWPWLAAQAVVAGATTAVLATTRASWLGYAVTDPRFFVHAPAAWSLAALLGVIEASVAAAVCWAWGLGRVAGGARRRGAWRAVAGLVAAAGLAIIARQWFAAVILPRWVAAQVATGHIVPVDLPTAAWMAAAVVAGGAAVATAWCTTGSRRVTVLTAAAALGIVVWVSEIYAYRAAFGVLIVSAAHRTPYASLPLGPLVVPWWTAGQWLGISVAVFALGILANRRMRQQGEELRMRAVRG